MGEKPQRKAGREELRRVAREVGCDDTSIPEAAGDVARAAGAAGASGSESSSRPPAPSRGGGPPWRLIGGGIVVAVAVVVIARGCGPDVIHDADGHAWFQTTGPSAEQDAIEACFKMGDRAIRYHGWGKERVQFCCAPRESEACDRPEDQRQWQRPAGESAGAASESAVAQVAEPAPYATPQPEALEPTQAFDRDGNAISGERLQVAFRDERVFFKPGQAVTLHYVGEPRAVQPQAVLRELRASDAVYRSPDGWSCAADKKPGDPMAYLLAPIACRKTDMQR